MRGPAGGSSGPGIFSESGQPVAIVAIVLILGASVYLWRRHYLRSRAALITIAAIVVALVYLGFFAGSPPT